MSEWVEINLVWRFRDDGKDGYEENAKMLERLKADRAKHFPECEIEVDIDNLPAIYDRAPEVNHMVGSYWTDQLVQEIIAKYPNDEEVIAIAKRRLSVTKCTEWENAQPYVQEWQARMKARNEMQASLSFINHDLCKPGVLIETKNEDGTVTPMLIGDINQVGGLCDDCGISSETIVLRAKDLRGVIYGA